MFKSLCVFFACSTFQFELPTHCKYLLATGAGAYPINQPGSVTEAVSLKVFFFLKCSNLLEGDQVPNIPKF